MQVNEHMHSKRDVWHYVPSLLRLILTRSYRDVLQFLSLKKKRRKKTTKKKKKKKRKTRHGGVQLEALLLIIIIIIIIIRGVIDK